ncbi:hypothetical protein [Rothia mucilaginosa]|uniref:hypothetical protein n=1 Tax=Rothia mucilaginosa TaxID=43675 RepID=UPI001CB5A381|nr:hypothetical protein [Rothia mucilaginosa]MBF1641683.1 hypothetical protein [Rothia mucilaginosa]UQF83482.1 MAG: hypothetical protein M3I37_02605 [Rothia mucilaginosa]
MTLLNTSGVLVILTVILLLWFVPRSLRRAPAGPVMEPERPLISAERTAEDILASAGVLLNESEAYQSSDHAVAPGTSLPSSALPQASSRSSHAVEDAVQSAPDTASISQIRESSPTAPYTDEIPVVEEAKSSPLSYFDTSSPSGIALLVAAGLGVLALVTGLLALFDVLAWGWAVLFLILAGGAWAVSRFGLLESVANQVKASRDARQAKAEGDEDDEAEDEAYEESDEHEEAGDDASEPVEDSAAEGVEPEVAEEPAHHARPATREATTRKSVHGVNREAARPSRAHIAVESSDEGPEAAPRAEAPAAAPAHSSRAVPARSARAAEAPVAHRQERRQQRPSRFQPIRRGSVLFDQESGSATSSASPRTAGQPQSAQQQPAQAPAVPAQPAQPVQPTQVQQAPAQAPVQPVAAPAQQSAIHPDQPVARQALRDGSPVRQVPVAPAAQAPAQSIPEEIPLPDVLDDSEFDALDIASLNDSALSTGATATGGVRSTNRHPGAGSSFEAVSNTWNPVQLPKPLSALHRQDKNQGKK